MLNKSDSRTIHPEWPALLKNKQRFSKVARELSSEAIRNNPGKFLQFTLSTFAITLANEGVNQRFEPAHFWREQIANTNNKWLTSPSCLTLAFRVDEPRFVQLADQGRRKTYPLQHFHRWVDDLLRPLGMQPGKKGLESFSLRPFGLLIVLGFLRSLRPGLNRRAALLLLPAGVYLFAVFAVGDAVGRYLHLVEWVAFVLAALAIEALMRLFLHGIRAVSRSL
jgi:hypothetical protein